MRMYAHSRGIELFDLIVNIDYSLGGDSDVNERNLEFVQTELSICTETM